MNTFGEYIVLNFYPYNRVTELVKEVSGNCTKYIVVEVGMSLILLFYLLM